MREKWSWVGRGVTALCFLINMLDGVDIFTLTYVAPTLQKAFGAGAEAFSLVFSVGLGGMALGGLFVAPLADRRGRRPVLLGALALMGLAMLASAYAWNVASLCVARLFVGVGIGTVLASISALSAGFAPDRFRHMAVGLPQAGYPIGATLAGFATAWALSRYGWQDIFRASGALTLALLPISFLLMPEAPETRSEARYSVGKAIGGPRLMSSLRLWVCTICGFMALYFIASWITKLAIQAGLPQEQAIIASAIYNAGSFVGTVLLSTIALRVDLRAVIATMVCAAAGLFLVFGGVRMPIQPLLAVSFLIGVALQGGVNGMYPLVASVYPAKARATGVGWAMGIGRLGALAGPLVGGWALDRGLPLVGVFGIFCAPLLLLAVSALGVRPARAGETD